MGTHYISFMGLWRGCSEVVPKQGSDPVLDVETPPPRVTHLGPDSNYSLREGERATKGLS